MGKGFHSRVGRTLPLLVDKAGPGRVRWKHSVAGRLCNHPVRSLYEELATGAVSWNEFVEN